MSQISVLQEPLQLLVQLYMLYSEFGYYVHGIGSEEGLNVRLDHYHKFEEVIDGSDRKRYHWQKRCLHRWQRAYEHSLTLLVPLL
jgi:hypothetical protein